MTRSPSPLRAFTDGVEAEPKIASPARSRHLALVDERGLADRMRHRAEARPVALPVEAMEELVKHGFRYALSLTHDHHRAEDLTQDACMAVAKKGGPWEKGYLFATIRNRYIDEYRRGRLVQFQPLAHEVDGEELPNNYASDDWEAPDHFENDLLEKALGTLRPEDRETMFLFAVEGFTAQEISDMTQRPRGTILSVIHRVRHKLRAELEAMNVQGARR